MTQDDRWQRPTPSQCLGGWKRFSAASVARHSNVGNPNKSLQVLVFVKDGRTHPQFLVSQFNPLALCLLAFRMNRSGFGIHLAALFANSREWPARTDSNGLPIAVAIGVAAGKWCAATTVPN